MATLPSLQPRHLPPSATADINRAPTIRWAWQNPHLSLKIPASERIPARRTNRGRRGRPPATPVGKLSHLHLLLHISSFSRWPLSIRFFAGDMYSLWNSWCEREATELRKDIKVVLDLRQREESADEDEEGYQVGAGKKKKKKKITKWGANGEGGVQGLDIGYGHLERHLQKSRDLLLADQELACCVCHSALGNDHSFTLVCPHAFCEHTAHITCLASAFLQQESGKERRTVLPTHGKCPSCHTETAWVDLVKELSVRTRAKPKKTAVKRKTTKKGAAAAQDDDDDEGEESEDEEGDITAADLADIPEGMEGEQVEWGDQDTDGDSALSDAGSEVGRVKGGRKKTKTKKALLVIAEDSDMDSSLSDVGSDTGSVRGESKSKKEKPKVKGKGKKALLVAAEDSSPDPVLSDADRETVSDKRASKPKKGKAKAKAQVKKALPAAIEDIDQDSTPSTGSETGSMKGAGGPRKIIRKAQRKKTLPIVVEDCDPSPVLSDAERELASDEEASKPKKGKGRAKAQGKKAFPVVVEGGAGSARKPKKGMEKAQGKKLLPVVAGESDWDEVDSIV